jgi:uncharacterized protein (TIGR00270 family)
MCGRGEARFKAKVAGMEANVCENCASHGEILEEIREQKPAEIRKIEKEKKQIVERTEEIVEDIGEQVRSKREELNLKQEELGKKISEHASMVKRIEHGYIPSLKIAHKLERVLNLKLTEFVNPSEQEYTSSTTGGAITLGDVMIIKKSKQTK